MLFKYCKWQYGTKYSLRKRRSTRLLLPLIIFTLLIIPTICFHLQLALLPHSRMYRNAVYIYTPRWIWPMLELIVGWPSPNFPGPEQFTELLEAPPMQTWNPPQLKHGSTFIRLHIFSTVTPSARQRRNLIRQHSPLALIPPAYRESIELKFILGHPDPKSVNNENVTAEEVEIKHEMEEYGDIVRLNGLWLGDNMNQGKSWEWVRWAGRGKDAQWVIKCDDDTFTILPKLINALLSLDPSKPTYFGTSMERSPKFHFYFAGMMYGFSWNVVKTLSAAETNEKAMNILQHEDARMGEVMYSLPTSPECDQKHNNKTCNPYNPPPSGWNQTPLSPDPRTGLVRYNFGHCLGPKTRWWVPKHPNKAIGWHGLKEAQDYVDAYEKSLEYYTREGWPWYSARALTAAWTE